MTKQKMKTEIERLKNENKGLKQSMDYERTLELHKHRAYMQLLEQIDKLQRALDACVLIACGEALLFNGGNCEIS